MCLHSWQKIRVCRTGNRYCWCWLIWLARPEAQNKPCLSLSAQSISSIFGFCSHQKPASDVMPAWAPPGTPASSAEWLQEDPRSREHLPTQESSRNYCQLAPSCRKPLTANDRWHGHQRDWNLIWSVAPSIAHSCLLELPSSPEALSWCLLVSWACGCLSLKLTALLGEVSHSGSPAYLFHVCSSAVISRSTSLLGSQGPGHPSGWHMLPWGNRCYLVYVVAEPPDPTWLGSFLFPK